jgi:hypothetical protein
MSSPVLRLRDCEEFLKAQGLVPTITPLTEKAKAGYA